MLLLQARSCDPNRRSSPFIVQVQVQSQFRSHIKSSSGQRVALQQDNLGAGTLTVQYNMIQYSIRPKLPNQVSHCEQKRRV